MIAKQEASHGNCFDDPLQNEEALQVGSHSPLLIKVQFRSGSSVRMCLLLLRFVAIHRSLLMLFWSITPHCLQD